MRDKRDQFILRYLFIYQHAVTQWSHLCSARLLVPKATDSPPLSLAIPRNQVRALNFFDFFEFVVKT